MKFLLKCFLGVLLLAFGAQAHALLITPSSTPLLASGPQTSQSDIAAAIASLVGDELYKQDVGGPESGSLSGSYATVFSNTPTDPADATITYTGGPTVGSPAQLLVKDGNQNPAWYLFGLAPGMGWNGMETLYLEGFWPAQGAISHVTLYGSSNTVVPEPATMLLVGVGLIGVAGLGRKRFSKS